MSFRYCSRWRLQVLPVNYAGLALIIVGIGLMIAEAFAPSFGRWLGGIAAFIVGSVSDRHRTDARRRPQLGRDHGIRPVRLMFLALRQV